MSSGSEKAPYKEKQLISNPGDTEVQAGFSVSAY